MRTKRSTTSTTFESAFVRLILTMAIATQCIEAFSSSQLGRAAENQQSQVNCVSNAHLNLRSSQTKQDIEIESWYKAQGIWGTSQISLCTSDASVGGRGLFWVNEDSAEEGDILAFIPSKCVIASSNLKDVYPEIAVMEDSEASWQAKLTAYACSCLTDPKPMHPAWAEWIKSWPGGGPAAPRPSSEYSLDEIDDLAILADATSDETKEAIDARYSCMKRDWEAVRDVYKGDKEHFENMYSIVVSRTARLGAEWQNKGGIIPLHDMCNHPPFHQDSNVELFCVGDVQRMIGSDNLNFLMKELNSENNLEYEDSDVLLVASRDIQLGEELWLKYKSRSEMETKEKLLLMLQYGFPFHF